MTAIPSPSPGCDRQGWWKCWKRRGSLQPGEGWPVNVSYNTAISYIHCKNAIHLRIANVICRDNYFLPLSFHLNASSCIVRIIKDVSVQYRLECPVQAVQYRRWKAENGYSPGDSMTYDVLKAVAKEFSGL